MGLSTEYIIKLLQLKGLGRKSAFKFCEISKDFNINSNIEFREFVSECVNRKLVTRISDYSHKDFDIAIGAGEKIIYESDKLNILIRSFYDIDFPVSLKNIPVAPLLLSFKGDYKQLNNLTGIAIIGTREPTNEGVKAGEYFGYEFAKRDFNIVSGLAIGCDTAGHVGALNANGITTAVLAHGLNTIYPKPNKELSEKIIHNGGILISEYLVGTPPLPNYFIERDRLQAGLSNATIVIQTGIKGGTMHAVRATIESKKPLFVVNYDISTNLQNNSKVEGNYMLINQGAISLKSNNIEEACQLILSKTNKNIDSINSSNINTGIQIENTESVICNSKEADNNQIKNKKEKKSDNMLEINFE